MQYRKRPLLGAGFMACMALIAPVHDAFTKLAGPFASPTTITFLRFIVPAVVLVLLGALMKCLYRPSRQDALIHLLRGSLLALGSIFMVAALLFMPLATAIAIFFIEPLLATLLATLILKEPLGPRRIIACIIGFIGAAIIIQPSFADAGWAAILPALCALTFALYVILTSRTNPDGHPVAIQAYTSIGSLLFAGFVVLIGSLFGSVTFGFHITAIEGLRYGLMAGLVGTISHIFVPYALRYASAATIAPIQYVEMISAVALGYFVFGEVLEASDFAGIALIVGSGAYVIWREQQLVNREELDFDRLEAGNEIIERLP